MDLHHLRHFMILAESRSLHSAARDLKLWQPALPTVLSLLRRLDAAGLGTPDLYIVTPFVTVADNLRQMLTDGEVWPRRWGDAPGSWARERVGTVHTVQGREAEAVIFVLGAPAPQQTGARGWAGGRPNLLNVAVTRAKEAVYVVGNRRLWKSAGVFQELDARLP